CGGKGKRKSGRPIWTARIVAFSMTGSRPRRTVSTSGSSGIVGQRGAEGSAVRTGGDAEMLGHRLADIGVGEARTDGAVAEPRPGADDGHLLTRMVGALP